MLGRGGFSESGIAASEYRAFPFDRVNSRSWKTPEGPESCPFGLGAYPTLPFSPLMQLYKQEAIDNRFRYGWGVHLALT